MILQANMAFPGQAVLRIVFPLSALFSLLPVFRPCPEFDDLFAVQPVPYMPPVENDPGAVPFSYRLQFLFTVSRMHRVIGAGLLPGLQLIRETHIIDQLILGAGFPRALEFRVFDDVIENPAVACRGDLLLQLQLEIVELFLRDEIDTFAETRQSASFDHCGLRPQRHRHRPAQYRFEGRESLNVRHRENKNRNSESLNKQSLRNNK